VVLKNALRLAVRGDSGAGTGVILSFAGAVNTQRYERQAQLAFVEDGVRIAAGEGIQDVELEGWPSLRELVDDANRLEIVAYACSDCADGRGVSKEDPCVERLSWVPTEDVHLPLHTCSKHRATESRQLRTVREQQAEQRQFDERVGHVTVGADRGTE
jgi:sulfur relay (sulfurtransferase) complex TusBCD TusD component (DsrE family)